MIERSIKWVIARFTLEQRAHMRLTILIILALIPFASLQAATAPTKPTKIPPIAPRIVPKKAAIPPKDPHSTYQHITVKVAQGTFPIDVVTLDRGAYDLITDTADATDCAKDCKAKKLTDYLTVNKAAIGIHGSYFCPPDYKQCQDVLNSYHWPVFNSRLNSMINADNIKYHEGPMMIVTADGNYTYLHRAYDLGHSIKDIEIRLGSSITAAIANYPSLVEGGKVIADKEERLKETNLTRKGPRGAIGFNDKKVMIVIAQKATVLDLAYIMKSLGVTNAMNLDGGGSVALAYDSKYRVGPGRLLPNAIVFRKK